MVKCINDAKGSRCYSPIACTGWRYCRQRNIDAGGMKNVSPADQAAWRKEDNAR